MIIVSDSTILIGLAKVDRLDLLREAFYEIYVPEEVFKEVTDRGIDKPGAQDIRKSAWIKVRTVKDLPGKSAYGFARQGRS